LNYLYNGGARMDSLKSIIKEYYKEMLYEADIVMISSTEKNLTVVTDNLRGLCGVCVVTITQPAKPYGEGKERTVLKVKFQQFEPTLKQHVKKLSMDARRIDGVISFIPIRAGRVYSRIYR
tara:strand:+ start:261 stop:623 length:363 start_codon:yes stop_codon:yes gene_type:complete